MAKRRRFHYVDFAASRQPGFRNHVVSIDEVGPLVAQYAGDECYASVFFFSEDVFLHLVEHRVGGRPSIAGYDGRVWAPFLPIDIDASPPGALADALDLCRRTYGILIERWRLPEAALHTYFSGAKGFHLLVDVRVFGTVSPAKTLPRTFSRLRLEILRALPDGARLLFDLAIGDKTRLLRLPNTRHRASGLYKVPLSGAELLGAPGAEIRSLARATRPLTRVTAAGLLPSEAVDRVPDASERYERARRATRRGRGPHPYRMRQPPEAPEEALCRARRAMWEAHVAAGSRNNVAIRLASAFRLAGYGRERARDLLVFWNRRWSIGLPEREVASVVSSAYARPYPYAYGCHDEVIRY
jgi:hypothetical protein